jgi:hypothetical protein
MRFRRDGNRIEALAYAYVVTGDVAYAERASTYLDAWVGIHQPDGNPVNERPMSTFVRGFGLVADGMSPSVKERVQHWLNRVATLQIERRAPPPAATSINNWNSDRLKIVGLIGYALRNTRFIRFAEDGYREQIAANLRPDGSSFDFHQRDALAYHVAALEPLLELAIAADKHGIDLYSHQTPLGASLERGIRFLLPYVRGERVHLEFVRTTVQSDRQRAAAGDPFVRIGAPWDPRGAAHLLEIAGYFNPAFAHEPIRGQVRRTFQTVLNGLRATCGGR